MFKNDHERLTRFFTVAYRPTQVSGARPSTSNLTRAIILALGALMLRPVFAAAQRRVHGFIDPMPAAKLKQLVPRAAAFTPREEVPLRFAAYAVDPLAAGATPTGYAFWTVDLVPEIRGYHGVQVDFLLGV